ncbi:hypothetical protein B0T21DRAFT_357010 [Apiosordaria backusii]|uniref:Uncharacterized protein n=1 Tax=Apiosordaria backusii TaxID=314023 RepID=A0AA40F060_9PEZI|nr:hypothetical protein B0T21DRAFT_357010 [Apiosordaria backusii]
MMETASLQLPKTGGKSRFSKALPVPPSLPALDFDTDSFGSDLPLPPPPKKDLPRPPVAVQTGAPLPITKKPVPAAKDWDTRSTFTTKTAYTMAAVAHPPPDSPLPRLPAKSPGLPPSVSVPRRRPVAATTVTSPSVPAPMSLPSPTLPERIPSPAGSYSSLLSAYSNHTSDSTPRTSTNSANEVVPIVPSKDSYTVSSPTIGNESHIQSPTLPPLSSDQHAQKQESNISTHQVFKEDLEELPPPPPLKDAQRSRLQTIRLQTSSSVQPPASTHTASSPLVDKSSPQDQLWRRRSLKAEKKVEVPELKLVSSHGSTAASNQPSQPPSQPHTSEQQGQPPSTTTHRAPPPQNFASGLPGRNIRPVNPSEQAVPQIEVNMGQEVSHVKDKLRRKGHESPPSANASSPATSLPVVSPLSAQRLPTPEYGSNDVKSPVLDMAVSPISPAITPELPSEQRPPSPPVPRNTLGPSEHTLRQAKSSPSLAPKASNSGLNGRSPIGLPSSPVRNRFANPPHSARFRTDEGSGFGGPNRRDPAGGPLPELQPPFPREPRSGPQSPAWGKPISENGSEITLRAPPIRPEFLDYPLREPNPNAPDKTDNPGAALFPRNWYTPLPADEILDARPLGDKHFRCITNHKIMTAGKQRNNPIACRTCGHKDRNAECYICSACHLNVCSGCSGLLKRNRGDLGVVLRAVEQARDQAYERGRSDADVIENTQQAGLEERHQDGEVSAPGQVLGA